MDILIRKEGKEVRRLWRIAPHKFDRVSPLEDARDLIARHQNRELPLRAFHPLRELPLRMRIGSIDFIQDQTQMSRISSKEGCDTSRMGTGFRKGLNVGKTAKRLRGIEFECFKVTCPCARKCNRRLPDARRTMEQEHLRIGRTPKILSDTSLHVAVSNNPVEAVRAACFAPHALASSSVRK
jgi:hypothetical protein